jgi:hypothetical protein
MGKGNADDVNENAGPFRTVFRRDKTHGYFLDEEGFVIPVLHQLDRIWVSGAILVVLFS